jgi:hypothetical protein
MSTRDHKNKLQFEIEIKMLTMLILNVPLLSYSFTVNYTYSKN